MQGLLSLLLVLCGCVGGAAALERDKWPAGLHEEHQIIIITACVAMGVGWACCVGLAMGKKWVVKLPVLILIVIISSVIPVGLITWGVTYAATRDVIQDKSEELLVATAGIIRDAVARELDIGVGILELTSSNIAKNRFDVAELHPEPNNYFIQLVNTVGSSSRSIEQIYYGTAEGRLVGAGIGRNDTEARHLTGVLPGDAIPFNGSCVTNNYIDECDVVPVDCADAWVGFQCGETCRPNVVSQRECTGFNDSDPHLLLFYVDRVTGDLATDASQQTGIETIRYDPRARPWYRDVSTPYWSDVYIFSGSQGGSGFTVSLAVKNPAGVMSGVLAVDYSVYSLSPLLISSKFSDSSLITIFTLDGILISSSLTDDELIREADNANASKILLNITALPGPKLRGVYTTVQNRYGTIEMAANRTALLQEGSDIILLYPIAIKGGLRLVMTISLPYSDVMGKADTASTTALLLAVAISIFCGALMYVGVEFLLRPLQGLATDMNEVAWMRLDAVYLEKNLSAIYEIAWMQKSFKLMVRNLMEYKEYLPQTVLLDESEEDSHSEHAPSRASASRTSKSSMDGDSSRMSTEVTSRVAVGLSAEIRTRAVTLMAVNIVGFHQYAIELTHDTMAMVHSKYLERIHLSVKSLRGLLEEFSGDRVLLSFNAMLANATHRERAARLAMTLQSPSDDMDFPEVADVPISIGIAGGKALCGNMGCTGLKKYCIISTVSNTVRALERLARNWDVKIMVDQTVGEEISTLYDLRKVIKANLKDGKVTMVHELIASKEAGNREWMYQLQTDETRSAWFLYNKGVDSLYKGDYAVARDLVRASPESYAKEMLLKWIQYCMVTHVDLPPLPIPIEAATPMPWARTVRGSSR